MAETRRKKAAKHPKLTELIGGTSELIESELPTLRQCLQYGLLIEERSLHKLKIRDKFYEVAEKVINIWKAAHPLMPVHSIKYVLDRLSSEWDKARNVSKLKADNKTFIQFKERLDKLFDICLCKCEIRTCADVSCGACENEAHIICTCVKKNKIPVIELKFMRIQREKIGERGNMQISSVDVGTSKKIGKFLKRKHDEDTPQSSKKLHAPCMTSQSDSGSSEIVQQQSASNFESTDTEPENHVFDVHKIAAASIRYGVSKRATAAISTATLAAAKDAGYIKHPLIVDPNKIQRSKAKYMKSIQKECSDALRYNKVVGIQFDGRKDQTKHMHRGKDGRIHTTVVKEEHYSICAQPGGDYLCHLTIDPDDRHDMHAAEHLGHEIFTWLDENDMVDSLQAMGGDSTNMNTGWKGGAIQYVEKQAKKRLIWLICALHTNELPLRHLFIELDGRTIGDNKFEGPLGKMVHRATELEVADVIPPVDVTVNLIDLEEDVVKDLSTDQKYLYEITTAIKKGGKLPTSLKEKNIGPHNHARWLNLANRLCRIWCSKHELNAKTTSNLKCVVQFIVSVYTPMWFDIKVKSNWLEGPNHILKSLSLVRDLPKDIIQIVQPYVKSSAWNAHSEHILQTMLSSGDRSQRKFAVDKILKIRGNSQFGDTSVRPRIVPDIKFEAKKLKDLIDWSGNIYEPVLTSSLSTQEVKDLVNRPMEDIPPFCVHGQSIERCVQEVTRASACVYGEERRDGFIKASLKHRELMPKVESKKSLKSLFL